MGSREKEWWEEELQRRRRREEALPVSDAPALSSK